MRAPNYCQLSGGPNMATWSASSCRARPRNIPRVVKEMAARPAGSTTISPPFGLQGILPGARRFGNTRDLPLFVFAQNYT
ncbi:MAG: hypothetical protein ACOCPQ_04955 [Desulfosudaceae bacterium]